MKITGKRVISLLIFTIKEIILLKRSKNTSYYNSKNTFYNNSKNTSYYKTKNKKLNELYKFGKITFV